MRSTATRLFAIMVIATALRLLLPPHHLAPCGLDDASCVGAPASIALLVLTMLLFGLLLFRRFGLRGLLTFLAIRRKGWRRRRHEHGPARPDVRD